MAESTVNWMQWPNRKPENWPVYVGCTPCSPGCENCWARRLEEGRLRHLHRCWPRDANGHFTVLGGLYYCPTCHMVTDTDTGEYMCAICGAENVENDNETPCPECGRILCGDVERQCEMCGRYGDQLGLRWWPDWAEEYREACEKDTRPLTIKVKYRRPFNYGPVRQSDDVLKRPLHWRDPRLVWCCPSSDPFHAEITDERIDRMMAMAALCDHRAATMANAPSHFFLFLTKRAERMAGYFAGLREVAGAHRFENVVYDRPGNIQMAGPCGKLHKAVMGFRTGQPLPNVGLGVTVCNQPEADKNLRYLLATPAAMRFLSIEPMLGPVDISPWLLIFDKGEPRPGRSTCGLIPAVNWVIVGCESGKNRRHIDNAHILSVVAQCKSAGVPVFVKQIEIDGRVSHNPADWPEAFRVQQFPAVAHKSTTIGSRDHVLRCSDELAP